MNRIGQLSISLTGSAEEMIANCDELITRFSSTAFVGIALGKKTHSDFNMDELRRLMPVQNNSAALNIAKICRRLLEEGCFLFTERSY
jgi:hypothetical protein